MLVLFRTVQRPSVALAAAAITALVIAGFPAYASVATPSLYRNSTAMHKRYPHGVGRVGARDHTSGEPVTNFRRSNALYRLYKRLDRDRDGIACEAH